MADSPIPGPSQLPSTGTPGLADSPSPVFKAIIIESHSTSDTQANIERVLDALLQQGGNPDFIHAILDGEYEVVSLRRNDQADLPMEEHKLTSMRAILNALEGKGDNPALIEAVREGRVKLDTLDQNGLLIPVPLEDEPCSPTKELPISEMREESSINDSSFDSATTPAELAQSSVEEEASNQNSKMLGSSFCNLIDLSR